MIIDEVKKNLKRGFFLTSLISCILCLTKSLDQLSANWIACLIPLLLSIILLTSVGQLEISYNCKSIDSKSTNMLLFFLYNISLSILLYFVLLALKIDESVEVEWYSVFIPLWYSLFIYLAFCVFMFPGMLDPAVNLKREAWTMVAFLINFVILTILLCAWLSDGFEYLWYALLSTIVFLPISFCLKIYSEIYIEKFEIRYLIDIESIFYYTAWPFCVTISLYETDHIPVYVPYIFLLLGVVGFCISEEYQNLRTGKESNNSNYEPVD